MRMQKYLIATIILIILATTSWAGHTTLSVAAFAPTKSDESGQNSGFLLKFDISSIPEGEKIDVAELMISVNSEVDTSETLTIALEPVQESWSASAAAISEGAARVVPDTLTDWTYVRGGQGKTITFDVTWILKRWRDGSLANNGFLVRIDDAKGKSLSIAQSGTELKAEIAVFHSK